MKEFDFAKWMKKRRAALGFSVSRLSIETGVPESTLNKYESGRSLPGFSTLVKITAVLGPVDLQDVFGVLDKAPTRVENVVEKISKYDLPDKAKAELLMQALQTLEAELK